MEDILFSFVKVDEVELQIADSYKSALARTREALQSNFDKADPQFLALKDALLALFAKKDLSQITQKDIEANTKALDSLFAQITELNRTNELIAHKFSGDYKFARIHKRIKEQIPPNLTPTQSKKLEMCVCESLQRIKTQTDNALLANQHLLDNEAFFEAQIKSLVAQQCSEILGEILPTPKATKSPQSTQDSTLDSSQRLDFIAQLITKEYLNQYTMEVA